MGNELSTRLPVMIQSSDGFVSDLPGYTFVHSLGSTRFMKVAKVRNNEGQCVLKIFVHQDQNIPLDVYRQQIERIRKALKSAPNCCPFQRVIITSRACFLVRQCYKYNMFDRLTTRPYLESVEKRWVAFQLLRALQQCHDNSVFHGDIKSQNVLLNSWNWVMLADFASFKPVVLPYDNPSDFAYFFDTSRRRTCYIAPERFDCSTEVCDKAAVLTEQMDVFSAALVVMSFMHRGVVMSFMHRGVVCVMYEIFTDGQIPFTFNQMLLFRRRNERGCDIRILEALADNKELLHTIVPCLDRLPEHRPTVNQLLASCRGSLFPQVFYDFCWPYLESFTRQPLLTEDEVISRLSSDLDHIFRVLQMSGSEQQESTQDDVHSQCYLLFISLAVSQIRNLKYVASRLKVLHILERFSVVAEGRVVLDRILPYLMYLLLDSQERVRARAVVALTHVLSKVNHVTRENARIFQDYIFPRLCKLTTDPSSLVRWCLASRISELAATAMRFVETAGVHYQTCDPQVDDVDDTVAAHRSSSQMGTEQRIRADVRQLQESVSEMLVSLLEDHQENIIKRALITNNLKQLCQFLGKQTAEDLILKHIITFLNYKTDHNLRATFYQRCTDAAEVVGWRSTPILKPLLQQGLCDSEETVVMSALLCCANMAKLQLLQKVAIFDLITETVPFVVHPNRSIRMCCVKWLCALGTCLNVADIHCKLMPVLQPYLTHQLITISRKELVLGNLCPSLPRAVWDLAVRFQTIVELMDFLYEKHMLTKLTPLTSVTAKGGGISADDDDMLVASCKHAYTAPSLSDISLHHTDNRPLASLYKKMRNHGLNETNEAFLLAFRHILLKMRKRVTQSHSDEFSPTKVGPGVVRLGGDVARKQADLTIHRKDHDQRSRMMAAHKEATRQRKVEAQLQAAMNDEWAALFGPSAAGSGNPAVVQSMGRQSVESGITIGTGSAFDMESTSECATVTPSIAADVVPVQLPTANSNAAKSSDRISLPVSTAATTSTNTLIEGDEDTTEMTDESLIASTEATSVLVDTASAMQSIGRMSSCRESLMGMIEHKRERWHRSARYTAAEKPSINQSYKPRAHLIAHVHEHTANVKQLAVHRNQRLFASASYDGTVKLWDSRKIESIAVVYHSSMTYSGYGKRVRSVQFMQARSHQFICSGYAPQIHIVNYESKSGNNQPVQSLKVDADRHGFVLDAGCWHDGWSDMVFAVTHHGHSLLWDLRSGSGPVGEWSTQNEHGLVTCFCVDDNRQLWAAVATATGRMILWDLRFQLPVNVVNHPAERCVSGMWAAKGTLSSVWTAFVGNGELSLWDLETEQRGVALWPSSCAPLSYQHTSTLCQPALHQITDSSLITGDSDGTLRYWNLNKHTESFVMSARGFTRESSPPALFKANASALSSMTHTAPAPDNTQYATKLVDGVSTFLAVKRKTAAVDAATSENTLTQPSTWHHDAITDIKMVDSGHQKLSVTSSREGVIKLWL